MLAIFSFESKLHFPWSMSFGSLVFALLLFSFLLVLYKMHNFVSFELNIMELNSLNYLVFGFLSFLQND